MAKIIYKLKLGPLELEDLEQIQKLEQLIFPQPFSVEQIINKMQGHKNLNSYLAYSNDQLIAYKISYEREPNKLYSWNGAVHPNFRRQGIATELMTRQHQFARDNSYQAIITRSSEDFPEMLALNLKWGFKEVSRHLNSRGEQRIVFEKYL